MHDEDDPDTYSDDALDEDSSAPSDDPESEDEDPNDLGGHSEAENVVIAETEIEGDFDRLVQDIRQRNDPSLAKDWDISIHDEEAAFKDDLRAASGIGKRRKAKSRASGPTLSQQVRSLIGDGNQAFVDNNLPEAIKIMQEVIRIEPRAASAWTVLAQCYEDMGQKDRALQLRIMTAHLRHDAEEWDRLARESRELGFHQQALYCYRKVYSLDPSNVDALWDRAALARKIGDLRIARQAFLSILKRFPHDLTVLSELRPILVEMGDFTTCSTLFQNAFDVFQQRYPTGAGPISGPPGTESTGAPVPGGGFDMLNLLVLADLYNTLGEYDKAVRVIKSGSRWLQGRRDQKYWDLLEDDREFDPEGFSRAALLAGNTIHDSSAFPNSHSVSYSAISTSIPGPSNSRVGTVEMQPGYFTLDVNARHRLAVARIKMGDASEGMIHANVVLQEDVLDYAPLFTEIADAYYERGMWAEARPVYETLGTESSTTNIYVLLQTASCLRMLDECKDAAEIYELVRRADPTNNEAKMKLAEIYEIMNEPRKALDLVYQVIDSRKRRNKEASQTNVIASSSGNASSLFSESKTHKASSRSNVPAQNRLTQAQLKELEAEKEKEVTRSYARVTEIWDTMMNEREESFRDLHFGFEAAKDIMEQWDGEAPEGPLEKEWMLEAEKLVDTFRETRNLFTAARNNPFRGMFPKRRAAKKAKDTSDLEADEDRMVSRLQLDLQNERVNRKSKMDGVEIFRGMSFKDWLLLIMQFCFILTRRNQYELADEILRHILMSNAYMTPEYQFSIRLALVACAIHTQHYAVVVEQCRKLISSNQFNNEVYRLLMASLSSGLRPTDSFITSTLQKFLFREMKLNDVAMKNPNLLKWNSALKRWAPINAATLSSGSGKRTNSEKDLADDLGEEDSDGGGDAGMENDHTSSNDRPALPTRHNPLTVAIYGQMCVAAKSYQSAIFYLLHAYDYCPEDPMVSLSLAIASVGRAMQRQSDNRHHLIAQGMAFLSKYRSLRAADPARVCEVEYNFGRMFQQLGIPVLAPVLMRLSYAAPGLHSHAVIHYERVLKLVGDREKENKISPRISSFAKESAYNLSLIYVLTGATPLADMLYRRWLSL
ncbi:hypothetical protein D9757_004269 [Collybiopsis confluens]|uniref:TPR-like protein n=1 Tax=Collybiopsis confluens TaxID=2823264 RepID=A0A8H5HTN1_9AGAR|nr:hypothetical protein D9757_004269 [Collybiopsis confluens]